MQKQGFLISNSVGHVNSHAPWEMNVNGDVVE